MIAWISTAWAWQISEPVWPRDAPIAWCVLPDPTAPLAPAAQRDLAREAIAAWVDAAPCLDLAASEDCDGSAPRLTVDFTADLAEGALGFVAWQREPAGPVTVAVDPRETLATDAEVADGACDDRPVRSTLLAGLIGTALGLRPPCGDDDPCVGDEATALLTRRAAPCVVARPGPDDAFGLIDALGPDMSIACEPVAGPVPVEATCQIVPDAAATIAWGDATTDTARAHTYDRGGRYDVAVRVADPEACAAATARFPANVLACAPNAADFSWERRGLELDLALDRLPTDLDCYDTLAWTVTDADGAEVATTSRPYATVRLPGPGLYAVRAAVTGLGGDDVVEQAVHVGGCGGCDAAGTPWAAPAALLTLARRRRSPRR